MRILVAISHGFASIQALIQLLNGLEMLLILISFSLRILAMDLTMARCLIGSETISGPAFVVNDVESFLVVELFLQDHDGRANACLSIHSVDVIIDVLEIF